MRKIVLLSALISVAGLSAAIAADLRLTSVHPGKGWAAIDPAKSTRGFDALSIEYVNDGIGGNVYARSIDGTSAIAVQARLNAIVEKLEARGAVIVYGDNPGYDVRKARLSYKTFQEGPARSGAIRLRRVSPNSTTVIITVGEWSLTSNESGEKAFETVFSTAKTVSAEKESQ